MLILLIPSTSNFSSQFEKMWIFVSQIKDAWKERMGHTFATPFGGYSPFNLGSTHCFTLSSPSLGVA